MKRSYILKVLIIKKNLVLLHKKLSVLQLGLCQLENINC